MNELFRDIKELKLDIKKIRIECKEFMKLGDISAVEERVVILGELQEKLRDCAAKAELYNSREAVSLIRARVHLCFCFSH